MIKSQLDWELFVLISALLGLLYAGIQSYLLLKIPFTEEKPLRIAKSIMQGDSISINNFYYGLNK